MRAYPVTTPIRNWSLALIAWWLFPPLAYSDPPLLTATPFAAQQLTATNVAPATDASARLFEASIRPLLIERCFECHAGEHDEGGLRLDSGEAIRRGGDGGPALIPHDVEASLLVSAIRYEGLEMPPDAPLSRAEQDVIAKWIEDGAKWPASFEGHTSETLETPTADRWWAAQPLDDRLPEGAEELLASPTRIDQYIDHALQAQGMHRAPETDRERLIRRLSLDLLGLPPSPEEIDRFVSDTQPGSLARLIDRMFANPAYGERMARLWLDLVRYAESDGWRQDAYRDEAYRYRQWVADAFNEGMPYDRFVAMQLAGDEIDPSHPEASVAVSFMRLGIFEYNQRDAEGHWQNIVDEITDVTADVFLATGMACAKCHDHKFDPISRADYYRLRSVFEPILFVDERPQPNIPAPNRDEIDQLLHELRELEGAAVKKLADGVINKFTLPLQAMYRKPASDQDSYEQQMSYILHRQMYEEGATSAKINSQLSKEAASRRNQILARLEEFDSNPHTSRKVLTIRDAVGEIRPTRLPGRTTGRSFLPGIPEVFGGADLVARAPAEKPQSTGRRSALAAWITSAENPIAARVLANRLWQYHFGTGLVESPNDFGSLGTPPTHPPLLDYLAKRLLETQWNIQAVQKEIVSSATYRQSSLHPDAERYLQVDAANRLRWRYAVRRLDAEQYRDALLVATGTLESVYGGASLSAASPRRSLYLQRKRNSADPMLQLLDAPAGLVVAAKRDETVTAPQALMMLNSPSVTKYAAAFAEHVERRVDAEDHAKFVQVAHRMVAGLEPEAGVIELLVGEVARGKEGKIDACHILLNSNAFLFIE